MGSRTILYVNEYDTSRHGLIVERVDGWRDGLSVNERTSQLPGRVGAVILPPESETTPRTITVSGVMKQTSLALVRSKTDELKERLYRGTIEVRFVDHADRYVLARCNSFQQAATPPQFLNPMTRVAFSLFCSDPLIYATHPTIVGFSATKAPLPLGTAPSAPIIRIMGAAGASAPTITYKDFRGKTITTMALSTALGANDYLEIDCELATVTKYAAGVSSNAIADITSGDFPVYDPQHADAENSAWPTVAVTAGAGTLTGECAFRRAWI